MGKMNFIRNQNKRMRLDYENNIEGNIVNDDLWGQEDITADEFDMLEFQATQSVPTTSVNNNVPLEVDSSKQKQYELEGKIKILSDTIETTKKELTEEKLKRDKIITEKSHEFKEKEKLLQKEIEKLHSSLQFKDQEMKAIHDKVKTLEIQLKENKVNSTASTSKSPNKYLQKFDFKSDLPVRPSEKTLNRQKGLHRKFALSVDMPKGQTQGCDIVSSILCNRQFPLQIPICATLRNHLDREHLTDNVLLSPVSVTKLTLEQKSDEILYYYFSVLENYVSYLQNFPDQSSSDSSFSVIKKGFVYDRTVAISCLKDLSYIISCYQFSDSINSLHIESLVQEAKKASQKKDSNDSSSASLSSNCDKRNERHEKRTHSLLTLLFILSKPDTYPNGFACKDEVELSLSALVSWSATNPKSLVSSFDNTVITSHISNCFNIAATNIVLRMLINICTLKEYLNTSLHNTDSCHLCAVATLLNRTISNTPLECIDSMIMAEDYLTSVFSVHSFSDMKLESSACSMMIFPSVLATLLKFYAVRKENCLITILLKKGFTLLHFLSKHIPNFKLRRDEFKDLYVSTVCVMLSLSKEDLLFRDFQEIAQELCDFQEDTSDIDLEDLSDDATPVVNLRSQNDS